MKKKLLLLVVVLGCWIKLPAQVWGDTPVRLPDDLPTETILFLKFDSVSLPAVRPESMGRTYYDKWKKHNESIPERNAQLRSLASKYPFNYKIVSMTDTAHYRSYGAKYVFWFNPFDMFTIGGSSLTHRTVTGRSGGVPYTASYINKEILGLMDLTSDKTFLVDRAVKPQLIYEYDILLPKLFKLINKQFGKNIK
jgi:hypothetical protein